MTPYECFEHYVALKLHFTDEDYDYHRYMGRTGLKRSSYAKRNDAQYFVKMSKQRDPVSYMVSQFIYSGPIWIGDMLEDGRDRIYTDWLRRQQSLTYVFTQEVKTLASPFNDNFMVPDGGHPLLYKMYRRRQVSPETMAILDHTLGFLKSWRKKITDPIVWPTDSLKLSKYSGFVRFDPEKCKKILRREVQSL